MMPRHAGHPVLVSSAGSRTGAAPAGSARWWALPAGLAVVVLLVFVAHWPALHAGAVSFDDGEYLLQNPLVLRPGWESTRRFLVEVLEPSTVHGYYQPLTMISLMLDVAIGGGPDHLLPFHRTSLILHAANTCLVVLLARMLIGGTLPALLVGLLFGVHPMTVETIAWVGERKTVLSTFFGLLSLMCYVRYARAVGSRASRFSYVFAALFYVLALLSKPTTTMLPLCMLVLDFWPLRRLGRRALVEKLPLLAIAAISAVITYESQRRTAVAIVPPAGRAVLQPLLIACHNVVFYLQNMLWPVNLSSHYLMPDPLALRDPHVLAGVVGTVILLVVLILSLRRTRAAVAGWLFFMIAIFPTLGVIGFTSVIAADKYAYLPAVGLLVALAALLRWAMERWPRGPVLVSAACLLFACAEGVATRAYLREWQTTERFFRYMLEQRPNAFALHDHLAHELKRQGRIDEAIHHFRRAIPLNPGYAPPYKELAILLADRRELPEAMRLLAQAIQLQPHFPEAYNTLGNVMWQQGARDQAEAMYRKAIDQRPIYADVHYNLGNALLARGDADGAIAQYLKALESHPDHFAARKNLGGVYLQLGRLADAVGAYRAALRLRQDPVILGNLAWILATAPDPALRDPAEAVHLAAEAIRLIGATPHGLATLGVALAQAGRADEAREIGRQAVSVAEEVGQPQLAAEIRELMQKYGSASSTHPTKADNPPN